MKSFAFVALLHIFASASPDGTCSEHDDTLLLQTKAVTKTISEDKAVTKTISEDKSKALRVHRFRVDTEENGVSLLQGHLEDQSSVVYSVEAVEDTAEEDTDGHGSVTDHCGEMHVFNAAGESLCENLAGCSAAPITSGEGFIFSESSDFQVDEGVLVQLTVAQASESDDVVLIAIPDMDEDKLLMAKDEIEKKMQDYPEASVLFTGAGARHVEQYVPYRWRTNHVRVTQRNYGRSPGVWERNCRHPPCR